MIPEGPNTRVGYMYRDASNYKQTTEVVFAGRLLPAELAAITANLEGGEWFIPSQVGLEDLQEHFGSRLYDDDHVWHELGAGDIKPTSAAPTEPDDVHHWARLMATTEWDVDKAMHEHGLDLVQEQGEYAGLPDPAREVARQVVGELHLAREHGQVGSEEDFAADVVTRLIRSYPAVAAAAAAAVADVGDVPPGSDQG